MKQEEARRFEFLRESLKNKDEEIALLRNEVRLVRDELREEKFAFERKVRETLFDAGWWATVINSVGSATPLHPKYKAPKKPAKKVRKR